MFLPLRDPEKMRGRLSAPPLEVSVLYDKDDRMPRLAWLHEYSINDSKEKRARALGLPWPPWVIWVAGFSTRVSARRSGSPSRRLEAWWGVRPRDRWERGHPTKDGP